MAGGAEAEDAPRVIQLHEVTLPDIILYHIGLTSRRIYLVVIHGLLPILVALKCLYSSNAISKW